MFQTYQEVVFMRMIIQKYPIAEFSITLVMTMVVLVLLVEVV